jgi:16S rRNA (cytosine967-C5)-methyltransferase
MNNLSSERLLACQIVGSLLQQRGSLASLLTPAVLAQTNSPALLQELCYGVCRWYPRLQFYLQQLLDKPLRSKDLDLHCLLLIGLYQLLYMRTPDHACVNESVEAATALQKDWAKNLINAVLRGAQRQHADLLKQAEQDYSAWYAHPQWLLDRVKKDWPRQYRAILDGNNERAPMSLRVHLGKANRAEALGLLAAAGVSVRAGELSAASLYLTQPMDTAVLPGFAEGLLSVQDEASQLVTSLLPLAPGLRVLDACAAPGGKTCALLEAEPSLQILALDNEARRLPRLQQNLDRLGLPILCRQRRTASVNSTVFCWMSLAQPLASSAVIRTSSCCARRMKWRCWLKNSGRC